MLLVFDLKLMEVDKLQVFTHLVFVLDLALGLQDLDLVRNVLRLQLVDLCLFLFQLVKHVLRELLSIVLTNSAVFCGA